MCGILHISCFVYFNEGTFVVSVALFGLRVSKCERHHFCCTTYMQSNLLIPYILLLFQVSSVQHRLAYPIEQLIDARTFECHEVVQQELGTAVQNES